MNSVSVIIPTLNEDQNIGLLVERINNTLFYRNIPYEIIIIDDNSTDATRAVAHYLSDRFPIKYFVKKGKPGKAYSLLEGFSHAAYDTLCMIDADLQYPPEMIPLMLDKMTNGTDIVVANRRYTNVSFLRKVISKTFYYFFGNLLHGLKVDVQSGLKVFKKEIIERIVLNPSPWSFDLEFLKKSKDAGYLIDSVDIDFSKRIYGESKINFIKSSWEIGFHAVRTKFQKSEEILFHPNTQRKKGYGFHYKGKEYIHHTPLHPKETAFKRLSTRQKYIIPFLLAIIASGIIINWHLTVIIIIALLTILYFTDLLFNLTLVVRSFTKPAEIVINKTELKALNVKNLPTYTVFCPLYKEWKIIPQFVKAMSQLDYPKEKLQVMLLLEEDDAESIEAIKQIELPFYFETVVVPHSYPKTKPKACNYGLTKATGEYVVIYDAEDIPDPLQLKKAIIGFAKSDNKVVCLQAKLNFYNTKQNVLTRLFTAEYSLWFNLVLTGLQSINAPIPLGGTSNHFRTNALRKLKGWDSFNVTEDADLGIRLAKEGLRTSIIESQTLEEANSNLMNWFNQRSRWIKGYIQTYLVHTRDSKTFLPSNRNFNLLTFQLIIGGKILSLFINPFMWVITIVYFLFRAHTAAFITSFFPTPILYMGAISLTVGNFLYLYYYMMGCARHGHYHLMEYTYLVPFYWLSMSVASWIALYQLIFAPHYWAKTKHGLHLTKDINSSYESKKRNPFASQYSHTNINWG